MPGIYRADRDAAYGRAGLALPFTPTQGPVRFEQDTSGFLDVPMHGHYLGMASKVTGLKTNKISECAVFAAAEWTGTAWGWAYFAHVQGGEWGGNFAGEEGTKSEQKSMDALRLFAKCVNLARCYSVVMVPSTVGYSPFAEFPGSLGFLRGGLSVYISQTGGKLGFAVEFRTMGEFGELGTPYPRSNLATPCGVLGRIGTFRW